MVEKQQKFEAFEEFLNQCEIFTNNERKCALSWLGDILKVKYANFNEYRLQGELTLKFSKHKPIS